MLPGPNALVLTSLDGVRYRFDPGALCLELLASGGEGWLEVYERLHEPGDVGRWLRESRLQALAPVDPGQVELTARDLERLKRVREAIRRAATSFAASEAPSPADLALINYFASSPPLVSRIDERSGRRRSWAAPLRGPQLLSTFARDAIDLFTGPLSARVRTCAGDNCSLLFVDTSRPGARRWCSMERCGNRHKVQTFRERREAHVVTSERAARRGSR
jgi:predicted RNA-binding Zn ribbon-like protein